MPTRSLPPAPSLVQLRKQARDLQRRLRSGDPTALALARVHLADTPARALESAGADAPGAVPLHLAQLILARSYGFGSWPRMTDQLTWAGELTRMPDVDPPGDDPVAVFLASAVLRYGTDDDTGRRAGAARMLAAEPSIGRADLFTACVTADAAAVAAALATDPAAADRPGGALRWEPLLYLAYARLEPAPTRSAVLETTRLLLAAGADPDAGFLWHGAPTPFTVLTGVFGSGELGSTHQPRHPSAPELARLLLDAGADPNDGQALYNRMFEPDDSHLVLLLEYGLGAGDGGPWHRRFPDVTDGPVEMLRGQLSWAVSHGMGERIALLARHGVDLAAPLTHWTGRRPLTPVGLALLSGHPDTARQLVALGAPDEVEPEARLAAALLAGREQQVAEWASPTLLARVRRRHPSLVLRATVTGSADGVRMLLAHGFDVNALGRQDLPIEEKWETALHHAAGEGDVEMVSLLLAAGADPAAVDRRFGATPLGWAEHFGREQTAELLRGVSPRPSASVPGSPDSPTAARPPDPE